MDISQVEVGKRYTYFPPKQCADDNRHFPCLVVSIAKRVRVRLYIAGNQGEILRDVSAHRLAMQGEIPTLDDAIYRLAGESRASASPC